MSMLSPEELEFYRARRSFEKDFSHLYDQGYGFGCTKDREGLLEEDILVVWAETVHSIPGLPSVYKGYKVRVLALPRYN